MKSDKYIFDWQDLAFASKKPVNSLKAIFIVAPREITTQRFKNLIKTYLPQGNIILGAAKENYVLGFEDQPQFKLQSIESLNGLINQVNKSPSKHKIYQLHYLQRDIKYLFEQLDFNKVILINGSWKYAWHTQVPYYALINRKIDFEYVSPFSDEIEALAYEDRLKPKISAINPLKDGVYSEQEMMQKTIIASHYSYDYCFQTGAVLGKINSAGKYKWIDYAFNKVVPYQTYAILNGSSRETHFSPPNDLNYYDTVHAEIMLILKAQQKNLKLSGTTLFINLLPCPNCARMLCESDISKIFYANDHSDGYALKLLLAKGKQVKRLLI